MQYLKMFALCLYPRHYDDIKKLNYVPVGLGEKNFQINGYQTEQVKISLKKSFLWRIYISLLALEKFVRSN